MFLPLRAAVSSSFNENGRRCANLRLWTPAHPRASHNAKSFFFHSVHAIKAKRLAPRSPEHSVYASVAPGAPPASVGGANFYLAVDLEGPEHPKTYGGAAATRR